MERLSGSQDMQNPTSSAAQVQSFYAVAAAHQVGRVVSPSSAPGHAVGGGAGAALAAPPAAAVPYLETDRNSVTIGSKVIACRCGCRSRFCENCCLQLGIQLKKPLRSVLATFRRVMMLTFTIDPRHFPGPREAFEHVKQSRCISVTMQALRRAGVLLSNRWFAVVEWQLNGWPHWHVLVEAEHIPHGVVCDAWNVNLFKLGLTAADTRVGFGSVRFTVSRFNDAGHAANYACAYLTKHPEHGYPEWVLNSHTRKVHRYSTSRGFWGEAKPADDIDAGKPGADDDADNTGTGPDGAEASSRRTISEQLSTCGQTTVVLREIEEVDTLTGEPGKRYEFLQKLVEPLSDLLARVPHRDVNPRGTSAELIGDLSWLAMQPILFKNGK